MTDIAPELIKRIRELTNKTLASSSEYKKYWNAIKNGSTDVTDTLDYADVIGDALGNAVKTVLSEETLPNDELYYNILQKIVNDVYSEAYDMCALAQKMVLEANYKASGYSIKAQTASKETKKKRLSEIVDKLSGKKYSEVKDELIQTTRSLPQTGASDTIYETGSFASEAGLHGKIRRTAAAGCCQECLERAGEQDYPGVDKIIFYRHPYCRCKVEYFPGNGKKQDVHTKAWTSISDIDKINYRIRQENTVRTKEKLGQILKIANVNNISVPAKKTSTENMSVNMEHIVNSGHDATAEEAISWVNNAVFSVDAWDGMYTRYFSADGAAYVNNEGNYIKTAYSKKEYTENIKEAIEEIENG